MGTFLKGGGAIGLNIFIYVIAAMFQVYNKRILSIHVLTPFSCVLLTLIALFQESEKLTSTDSKPITRYLRGGGGGYQFCEVGVK